MGHSSTKTTQDRLFPRFTSLGQLKFALICSSLSCLIFTQDCPSGALPWHSFPRHNLALYFPRPLKGKTEKRKQYFSLGTVGGKSETENCNSLL